MPSQARIHSRTRSDALIPATLVIGAGQSNCQGWATDTQNITALSPGNGYQFFPTASGATDGVWLPLHPMKLGRTQAGPHCSFAQTWAVGGGGAVLWVDVASGGSSMVSAAKPGLTTSGNYGISGGTWDLSDNANIYQAWAVPNIKSAIASAQVAGFSIKKIVVLWSQGEQDAGANSLSNGPDYRTKLVALIDRFKADFDISCFMIAKTTTNSTPGSFNGFVQAIRTAQDNVATDRPLLCPTPVETSAYFDNGWFVDGLHYTAAGYNDLGSTAATRGLAFTKIKLPSPPVSKHYELSAAFPYIPGWHRVVFEHQCSGTFGCDIYSGLNTPDAASWVDGSGLNKAFAGTSVNWTFTGNNVKRACLYINATAGSPTLVPGSTAKIVRMQVLDKGARIGTLNFGSGGTLFAPGFYVSDLDFQRIDNTALSGIYFPNTVANDPRLALTSAFLTAQPNLTAVNLTGCRVPGLDVTKIVNCTSFTQNVSGLTVDEVNATLVALDSNGKTGGVCNVSQFQSGQVAAAVPTGAGATAKSSLQGKGWTVTTD